MDIEFAKWLFNQLLWPFILLALLAIVFFLFYKKMGSKPEPVYEPDEWRKPRGPLKVEIRTENSPEAGLPAFTNMNEEDLEYTEEFSEENQNALSKILTKDKEERKEFTKEEQFLLALIKSGKGTFQIKSANRTLDAFGIKWKAKFAIGSEKEEVTVTPVEPVEEEDEDAIPEEDIVKELTEPQEETENGTQ